MASMDPPFAQADMHDFHLDTLGQQPRVNRLYTQLTFCFELPNDSSALHSEVLSVLRRGTEQLSASVPWAAGQVVHRDGSFKIQPSQNPLRLSVKYLSNDSSFPRWDVLSQAEYPFSMLEESAVAPCRTLAVSNALTPELPVFLVQANFITGGLLLTFCGQHGSMDMTGLGQLIHLFAKACRNEPFTSSELSISNMDRRNIIPTVDESTLGLVPEEQHTKSTPDTSCSPLQAQAPRPITTWAYFIFSSTSLASLKSLAMETVIRGSFFSTDDILSAFIWQSVIRARSSRLDNQSVLTSRLSRNVDMRCHLSIPSTYPGFVTESTIHDSPADLLVRTPLGIVAVQLRSALNSGLLRRKLSVQATRICRHPDPTESKSAISNTPALEIRLSSWAKEKCHSLDFGLGSGIGTPKAVRRPGFVEGAREGLVYFLPKTPDGEIAVGLCLRPEGLESLKDDKDFTRFGRYIG